MKIGVMTPTYNRPDLIRSLVLQMQNQSTKPDILVIHHNGIAESYQWAICDIISNIEIVWLHAPSVITQQISLRICDSFQLLRRVLHRCAHFRKMLYGAPISTATLRYQDRPCCRGNEVIPLSDNPSLATDL